ncbi:MAG: methyltransferase domain-containing protein [Gemmatimonadota bacterium]
MGPELFRLHARIEGRHWWFAGRRRVLRALGDAVLPDGGGVVVDIGCGTGANIAAFAAANDAVGVDPSADGVRLARERFPTARFVEGTVPGAGDDEVRRADLVLLTDVIEHVRDDFLLTSSVLALMAPGSHLLLTVPAHPDLWSVHDVTFGHYRRYTADRLRLVWRDLHVTERLLSPYNSRLFPLIRLVRRAGARLGRTTGREGTDLRMPPAPANAALASIFGGEARALLAALREGGPAYRDGLSLIALLRREDGPLEARRRGPDVPGDAHNPNPTTA